jgi:hypothetical protein
VHLARHWISETHPQKKPDCIVPELKKPSRRTSKPAALNVIVSYELDVRRLQKNKKLAEI